MLKTRFGLACLVAGVSVSLLACDGQVGGGGSGVGDGVGGESTGVGGSHGAAGASGAAGTPGTAGSSGTAGAPGVVDAAGGTGNADAARDSGGSDVARPGTGGSNPGTGGRATGGASGAAGAGGAGALPPLTIWIAGDSTVANGSAPCPIGWGGQFKAFFNNQVTVTNSAVAGRSVRTWLYFPELTMDATGECILPLDASGAPTIQSRWQAMLSGTTGMKAGDYLFIQFGINDSDPTCDRHVGLDAFKASYGVMAQAAQARGAHPIFLTPVSSIACSGANPVATRGGYVPATTQAGTQFGAPVIDLNALSVALYRTRGFCPIPGGDVSATTTGPVGDFFCDDHTHFSPTGAVDISTLVASAVRAQIPGLAAYLK